MALVERGLVEKGPSWTDDVVVEERRLQQYLHQKQHTMILKGAAEEMKHTLQPIPTSSHGDGFVHLGDSLMLRSACTGGLLQADIVQQFEVGGSAARAGTAGAPISSGLMLTACPRNIFTLSRVSDTDGFGEDPFVHYGQSIRLGTIQQLHDRQFYLLQSDEGAEEQFLEEGEKLACLYPRAGPATHWRLVRVDGAAQGDDGDSRVKLGEAFRLESVGMRTFLGSDETLRKTHYGNEFRVFGLPAPELPPSEPGPPSVPSSAAQPRRTQVAAPPRSIAFSRPEKKTPEPEVPEVPATTIWSLVDSAWADHIVAAVQRATGGDSMNDELGNRLGDDVPEGDYAVYLKGLELPPSSGSDTRLRNAGEMLKDPTLRAEHELQVMESAEGAAARLVLGRVFPMIRDAGMHVTRKLRRMCADADVEGQGTLPLRTFAGILSWIAVRLREQELRTLGDFLAPEDGSPEERGGLVDYRRFFALMAPPMQEMRWKVVRDAYAKLRSMANGGVVEVVDVQRWNPRCHPGVQSGTMTEFEAREEFLRQWEVTSPEAVISWEEFFDYYQDVSLAVENVDIFIEIVRRAWDL